MGYFKANEIQFSQFFMLVILDIPVTVAAPKTQMLGVA